ncbi:hypothetical protein AGMMS50218_09260 [Actinomycetota bacterium]|nr:hypothetical protein AGMMS50218_09260 [Actinomycetota bacterium]
MSSRHHRTLVDSFELGIPPQDAFGLFTARGERAWAPGWDPQFPADTPDDGLVGTVFVTEGDAGRSTWVVVDSERGSRIRYARVAGARTAGTVDVRLAATRAGTQVTVGYDLTSLELAADADLDDFAAGYGAYVASWRDAIEVHLAARRA